MNIHKLINDIKSEIPEDLMCYEYEVLESFFDILCWKEKHVDEQIRNFATAFFEMMWGEPYTDNDWLDRIYQIIDGKLYKFL